MILKFYDIFTETAISDEFSNLNVSDIVTPIKVDKLRWYLDRTNYNREDTRFLVEDFTNGFSIEYKGSMNKQDEVKNIPITVGTHQDMWDKLMKEVRAGRTAGPFSKNNLPYDTYVQSPIGLVLKVGGKTQLIFHLSYEFKN